MEINSKLAKIGKTAHFRRLKLPSRRLNHYQTSEWISKRLDFVSAFLHLPGTNSRRLNFQTRRLNFETRRLKLEFRRLKSPCRQKSAKPIKAKIQMNCKRTSDGCYGFMPYDNPALLALLYTSKNMIKTSKLWFLELLTSKHQKLQCSQNPSKSKAIAYE